jgi:hypothetical protein
VEPREGRHIRRRKERETKISGRASGRRLCAAEIRIEDDELAPDDPARDLGHRTSHADGPNRVEDVMDARSQTRHRPTLHRVGSWPGRRPI